MALLAAGDPLASPILRTTTNCHTPAKLVLPISPVSQGLPTYTCSCYTPYIIYAFPEEHHVTAATCES